MKQKKIPLRLCLGCRQMKPKKDLIRAVKSPEGEVTLDFTGKKSGRGAYICPDKDCLNRAIKNKALSRVFSTQIPDSIMEELNARANEHQ